MNKFKTKVFWVIMMEHNGCLCTELFQLLVIICSISPGTGPLERAYSKLSKICKADRNQLSSKAIESLWLLAIFDLKDDDNLFDGVRDILGTS